MAEQPAAQLHAAGQDPRRQVDLYRMGVAVARWIQRQNLRQIRMDPALANAIPRGLCCAWGCLSCHPDLLQRQRQLSLADPGKGTGHAGEPQRRQLAPALLTGVPGVLELPPCFHSADDWAVLVAEGVIDGAIVSSLCHHQSFQAGRVPQWEGVRAVPLATLELHLVCHQRWQGSGMRRCCCPMPR